MAMEIQGSINQLLTLAAAGAHLSPGVQKLGKLRDIKKQESALAQQRTALPELSPSDVDAEGKPITALGTEHVKLAEEESAVAREKFKLKPTRENARSVLYSSALASGKPVSRTTVPATEEEIAIERWEIAQEEADKRLREEQTRLSAGREAIRPSGIILTPPSMGVRRNTNNGNN